MALGVVLGPAGLALVGTMMAGIIGGMAGGALTGGLQGGWKGALIGGALGGALGGLGGWAGSLHNATGNTILGGMLAAGVGYAAATDSWDSLAGGLAGAAVGYGIGMGIANSIRAPSPNLAAETGSARIGSGEAKVADSLAIDQKPVVKAGVRQGQSIEVYKVNPETGVRTLDGVSTPNGYYPTNRGFLGEPRRMLLRSGDVIDRYGPATGNFASPQGVSAAARSLPPGVADLHLNTYEVIKTFDVYGGPAVPAFNHPGHGMQYDLGQSVQELVDQGYLKQI